MKKQIVIIGTSAAAIGCINKLRMLDKTSTIICISDEAEMPYNKCFLADYLAGRKPEAAVFTRTREFFDQNNIQLILGKCVVRIEPDKRQIVCVDNSVISYTELLIATGSSPYIPAWVDKKIAGVCTFHTLSDTQNMLAQVARNQVRNAVIIGAGLSGLEAADALVQHGVTVKIIERAERILARQLDERASQLLQNIIEKHGVTVHTATTVAALEYANEKVTGVRLASGEVITADLVICATGLQPNSHLVQNVGIECLNGSIITDECMRTSVPNIYAAGDVAAVRCQLSNTLVRSCMWPDAMMQGLIVAHAIAGQPRTYSGVIIIASSSFFGTQFVTCGSVAETAAGDVQEIINHSDTLYQKLLVHNNVLVGFLLLGDVKNTNALRRAVLTRQLLTQELLEELTCVTVNKQ